MVSELLPPRGHAVQAQSRSTAAPASPVPARSLPQHERLVDLHGSVIDYSYGGGSSIAVLLIMERLHRDLYTGLKVRPRGQSGPQPAPRSPLCPVFLPCLSTPPSFPKTFLENNQALLPSFPKNLKNFSESIFLAQGVSRIPPVHHCYLL